MSWTYGKTRPNAAELTDSYIRKWDERRLQTKKKEPEPMMPPTICFSRKIGVGSLEITAGTAGS